MQISLPKFAFFSIKSPNITQRSVSQENAFKKEQKPFGFSHRKTSSVASPICQEGQSERTFPILAFSSRFSLFFSIFTRFSSLFPSFSLLFPIFDNFFAVKGGTLPPCPYTGYATAQNYGL